MGIVWVPLFTYQFVAYTLCSLAIEMNTVFLHLRFMCVFFAVDKSSGKYRIVAILNIGKKKVFRKKIRRNTLFRNSNDKSRLLTLMIRI